MKVRLMGTRAECDGFVAELVAATPPGVVREVSGFYPNRAPSLLGRVYLDLALPDLPADAGPDGVGPDGAGSAGDDSAGVPAPRPAPRTGKAARDSGAGRATRRRGGWGR